jgi:4-amino-4-deoxy-L-arabinose transferase-like glycosyltransferase
VYGAARQFADERKSLIAAIFAGTSPGIFISLHGYMLEMPVIALVSLAAYLFIKSKGLRSRRYALLAGLACGFGALTKFVFPFFAAGLFLASFLKDWSAKSAQRRLVLANGALCILAAAAVAAPWYWPNRTPLIQELTGSGFLDTLQTDGFDESVHAWVQTTTDPKSYATPILYILDTVFNPLGAPLWLFLFILEALRDRSRRIKLVVWLYVPLLLLALIPRKQTKEAVYFIPLIALIMAMGLAQLQTRFSRFASKGVVLLGSAIGLVEYAIMPILAGPLPLAVAQDNPSLNAGYYTRYIDLENVMAPVRWTLLSAAARNYYTRPGARDRFEADRYFFVADGYGLAYWGPRFGLTSDPTRHLAENRRALIIGVFVEAPLRDRSLRIADLVADWSAIRYWAALRRVPALVFQLIAGPGGCSWPVSVRPDFLLADAPIATECKTAYFDKWRPVKIWTHTYQDQSKLEMYQINNNAWSRED